MRKEVKVVMCLMVWWWSINKGEMMVYGGFELCSVVLVGLRL